MQARNLLVSKATAVEKLPRATEKVGKPIVKAVVEPPQLARKPVIRTFKGIVRKITDTEWAVGAHKVIADANTAVKGAPNGFADKPTTSAHYKRYKEHIWNGCEQATLVHGNQNPIKHFGGE